MLDSLLDQILPHQTKQKSPKKNFFLRSQLFLKSLAPFVIFELYVHLIFGKHPDYAHEKMILSFVGFALIFVNLLLKRIVFQKDD
jgi:hypothetical protein